MRSHAASALQVAGLVSIGVGFGLLALWAGLVVGGVLAVLFFFAIDPPEFRRGDRE